MRILALDLGARRTGVAYAAYPPGIPLALPTLCHASSWVLLEQVHRLIKERKIDHIVVGLPLLSSGREGKQARSVRALLPLLARLSVQVSLLDERYSTVRDSSNDPDAAAACAILTVFLDRLPPHENLTL